MKDLKSEVGARIRQARVRKGLTQVETGKLVGLTDAAVRLYELGMRTPSGESLERIADTLGVPVEALMNLSPSTDREALEMLFRLEEECGCRPCALGGGVSVSFDDASDELKAMIAAWAAELELLNDGQITEADYAAWKASFKG